VACSYQVSFSNRLLFTVIIIFFCFWLRSLWVHPVAGSETVISLQLVKPDVSKWGSWGQTEVQQHTFPRTTLLTWTVFEPGPPHWWTGFRLSEQMHGNCLALIITVTVVVVFNIMRVAEFNFYSEKSGCYRNPGDPNTFIYNFPFSTSRPACFQIKNTILQWINQVYMIKITSQKFTLCLYITLLSLFSLQYSLKVAYSAHTLLILFLPYPSSQEWSFLYKLQEQSYMKRRQKYSSVLFPITLLYILLILSLKSFRSLKIIPQKPTFGFMFPGYEALL
jgi:hypothetical protein